MFTSLVCSTPFLEAVLPCLVWTDLYCRVGLTCFSVQNNLANKDPAKETSFHNAVEMQGALLGKHEEDLSVTKHAVESLATFKK